jgi:hypothetical protein
MANRFTVNVGSIVACGSQARPALVQSLPATSLASPLLVPTQPELAYLALQ